MNIFDGDRIVKTRQYLVSWLALLLCCSIVQSAWAYEAEFHRALTDEAINESCLASYLTSNLGFDLNREFRGPGYGEFSSVLATRTIRDWIIYGSWKEDKPMGIGARAVKHFYNPTPYHPPDLTDLPASGPFSRDSLNPDHIHALQRATTHTDDGEPYSWADARNYYYLALTSATKEVRDENFAKTFRALGQVIHLLEDMAVPAHVRNDAHDPIIGGTDFYEHTIRDLQGATGEAL